jgi:hypothetical protein
MSKLLLAVTVAFVLVCYTTVAFGADAHSAPHLRMGVGARAMGFGTAFTAIADDATAAYWNPAGLVQVDHIEATFMYAANMAVDRSLNYFGYAQWLGTGALGISWVNAGMQDMPLYDGMGNRTGTDDYSDNAVMFSYAVEAGSLMLGGTAKILAQNTQGTSATGFGVDLGGMFMVTDNVSAGLMIRDIGSQYGDTDVPLDWRVGTAVKALDGGLKVGFDIGKTQHIDDLKLYLGGEYGMEFHPGYSAFFRVGLDDVERRGYTAGLGIAVPYISFDYTYVTEKEEDAFGNNHRVSVTARW